MEAPQMRGVEEPLLPEPRAVEGGATQSEGAIETQEARYPRLHKTAGLRSLDVWVEISTFGTYTLPASTLTRWGIRNVKCPAFLERNWGKRLRLLKNASNALSTSLRACWSICESASLSQSVSGLLLSAVNSEERSLAEMPLPCSA